MIIKLVFLLKDIKQSGHIQGICTCYDRIILQFLLVIKCFTNLSSAAAFYVKCFMSGKSQKLFKLKKKYIRLN